MTHQELTSLLRAADQRTSKQGKPTAAAKRAVETIKAASQEVRELYGGCSATDEQKIRAILEW